jgi:hypothetical protein
VDDCRNADNSYWLPLCTEISRTKKRVLSLVASDLQPNSSHSDKALYSELCSAKFGIQPQINSVKRIGQLRPGTIRSRFITFCLVD